MPDDVYKDLDKAMLQVAALPFKSQSWRAVGGLISIVYALTIWPFSMMARELLFVGRGDRAFTTLAVGLAAVWIFALAARSQDLGGDALFLLGAFLVGKWALETLVMLGHGGDRDGSRDDDGESVFAMAGVRNATLTLVIGALFGLLLWPFPIGELVGPLLAFGCSLAICVDILENMRARAYRARERLRDDTSRRQAEMREGSVGKRARSSTFQRVEID